MILEPTAEYPGSPRAHPPWGSMNASQTPAVADPLNPEPVLPGTKYQGLQPASPHSPRLARLRMEKLVSVCWKGCRDLPVPTRSSELETTATPWWPVPPSFQRVPSTRCGGDLGEFRADEDRGEENLRSEEGKAAGFLYHGYPFVDRGAATGWRILSCMVGPAHSSAAKV